MPRNASSTSSAKSSPRTAPPSREVMVDLALQGGGSHGAFTWGVLDRLLDERWLWLDGPLLPGLGG